MCISQRKDEWDAVYGMIGQTTPQLMKLPLDMLDPWCGLEGEPQPFKLYSEEKLEELADNIRVNGVIEPICVRPNGIRFEIIAGHNRVAASKLAGLITIPALVQELDDDQAAILMVDSNLQHREKILPSEKARAYKTRLEALKRSAGRPKDDSFQLHGAYRSDSELSESVGESPRQIQRYIRLTHLIPNLLDLVDSNKLKLIPAVELSYLSDDEQELLYSLLQEQGQIRGPNIKKARLLKDLSMRECFTEKAVKDALWRKEEGNQKSLSISVSEISAFFPKKTSARAMKNAIIKALAAYRLENNDENEAL